VFTLDGFDARMECLVFADAYARQADTLEPDVPVFVEGVVNAREGEAVKLVAERIIPLAEAPQELTQQVHIRIWEGGTDRERLERLYQICRENAGETALILCVGTASGEVAFLEPPDIMVRNSENFRQAVVDLFGEDCFWEYVRPVAVRRREPAYRRFNGNGAPQQPTSTAGA